MIPSRYGFRALGQLARPLRVRPVRRTQDRSDGGRGVVSEEAEEQEGRAVAAAAAAGPPCHGDWRRGRCVVATILSFFVLPRHKALGRLAARWPCGSLRAPRAGWVPNPNLSQSRRPTCLLRKKEKKKGKGVTRPKYTNNNNNNNKFSFFCFVRAIIVTSKYFAHVLQFL